MIKKIFCAISMCLMTINSYANIHIPANVALSVLRQYFPDKTVREKVISVYNMELNNNNPKNTVSAESIAKICDAAGWDRTKDKAKRAEFRRALVSAADDNYTYYEVCGKDKGKIGKDNERCIEFVFYDIEVQFAQAKNLAQEYAREKYNDEIVCSSDIREGVKDDYIKCTSKLKPIYYEFKFDDAKESNANANQYTQRDFGRGLCLIYGGKSEAVAAKPIAGVLDNRSVRKYIYDGYGFDFECQHNDCGLLNEKLSKWGYGSVKKGGVCVVSYDKEHKPALSNDYYTKFDGKKFDVYYKGNVIKSWPAVSGRGKSPRDSRPTVCQLPEYQACEHIGPTPSGVYYIYQNEIQYMDNITVGNFNNNSLLADKEGGAWGKFRVPLRPDTNTDLFGRKPDMYIHGGSYAGSAGCIDLTSNIDNFIKWFEVQTDFSSLKVIVDYGPVSELCTDCEESQCMPCKCKEEINKDTEETNCDYI